MIYSSWLPGQPSHSRKHFYYYCHYKSIFLYCTVYVHNCRLCYLSKWKFAQSPPPYNFLPRELAKYANLHNFSLLHHFMVFRHCTLCWCPRSWSFLYSCFLFIYIFCIKEHTTCLYVFYKVWPWVLMTCIIHMESNPQPWSHIHWL